MREKTQEGRKGKRDENVILQVCLTFIHLTQGFWMFTCESRCKSNR